MKQLQSTVVIVGGGFAGLNAAKQLSNQSHVSVLLIDQNNYHLFQPLLYQVATAGLSPGDIAVPIRSQFNDVKNVEVHWAEVTLIDFNEKLIRTNVRDFSFDYVIVACGAQHSYFYHPEWEEFAPGLKTLQQATEIRRRILSAFENAENETDLEKQKALLNFVIVGGGPTGVELAGAIADISRTVLIDDFKHIDPSQAKIILLEAGDRLLTSFDQSLSARAREDLIELGVEVRLSARVDDIDTTGVRTGSEFIPSKSVFWAAGVQAAALSVIPEVVKDHQGRWIVNDDLSIKNYPFAFAVGDMAAVMFKDNKLVPGLAPAAMQEGRHAAQMILNSIDHSSRVPFRYKDKGQMATIGKNRAVMQAGPFKVGGRIAWLAWLFVHVFYLIGFKNRIFVIIQWAWSYIFSKRGARLILKSQK